VELFAETPYSQRWASLDFNVWASLKCHRNTLSTPATEFNPMSHAVTLDARQPDHFTTPRTILFIYPIMAPLASRLRKKKPTWGTAANPKDESSPIFPAEAAADKLPPAPAPEDTNVLVVMGEPVRKLTRHKINLIIQVSM
jgi:hypothetical protein